MQAEYCSGSRMKLAASHRAREAEMEKKHWSQSEKPKCTPLDELKDLQSELILIAAKAAHCAKWFPCQLGAKIYFDMET